MPSTYSSNLRLELIGTGEQQGTWGSTTNKNLGTLIEQAIGGYASVTVSNVSDTTLTTLDGLSDQSRNMTINLVGTISAARNVICPAIQKLYVVKNATTGGFDVTFKVSGQTGVVIPNGTTAFVYVDGVDVRAINGSIASQSANNVSITGGSITGITDLAIADGGTGASTAANARTNLGLGTISTQNANAVAITGGSISGITDLAVADGGTGASDASGARTNLGLGTIATQNANAVSITGGDFAGAVVANTSSLSIRDSDSSHVLSISVGTNLTANRVFTLTTGDNARTLDISASNVTVTTAGAAILDDATAADQRTTLGIGTIATQNSNNVSITGGAISGITDLAIADGGTGASTDAQARTNLGLAIGTNVQAYDATLQSLSSLGTAADRYAYTTGVDTWAEGTITSAGRAILDDADASAQRTTLGLGTAATLNVGTSANNIVQLDGTAKLPAVDGSQLTGISTFTMPSGAVMPYAGASEPSGWLLCFGQAVSRTTYAALFAIVGTTYGAGDGSTTFNLPDLRGRVVAGQDDMGGISANRLTNQSGGVDGDVLGASGGAETHTLTTAQMPAHTHTTGLTASGSGGWSTSGSPGNYSSSSGTGSTGGGGAHNNVQPTFILNYIIKT